MSDDGDWAHATWEGNRRRQRREFAALPFPEKLAIIEQMSEVVAYFAERRKARGLPVHPKCLSPLTDQDP